MNGGPRKFIIYFMENPNLRWMIWRYPQETSICVLNFTVDPKTSPPSADPNSQAQGVEAQDAIMERELKKAALCFFK